MDIWNRAHAHGALSGSDDGWISQYAQYLGAARRETVLDLGCGSGANALLLSAQGYRVLACDFSGAALERIREKNPSVATACFDMTQLPWPIEERDVGVVLASLSTHYFSAADTQAAYDHIHDMLKPGGHLIFRVNDMRDYEQRKAEVVEKLAQDYYRMRDGCTRRFFDMDAIKRLLARFELVELRQGESEYCGHHKYFIEGVARKQQGRRQSCGISICAATR